MVALIPAVMAVATVMGTWMNCEPDRFRGNLLFFGFAVLAWLANVAAFVVVRHWTLRSPRWRRSSVVLAVAAMAVVAVPVIVLASVVEEWQIGVLRDAGIAGPQCGPGGEPYDWVT
jgi:hypothetical protein